MEVVPSLWSWDALSRLHELDDTHTEERGNHENFIQFAFRVLEQDAKEGRPYIHVLVEVVDATRTSGYPGSSTTPLCTSFLLYADGKLDMPTARDTYAKAFATSNKSLERTREG
jgi:hypothetical protein